MAEEVTTQASVDVVKAVEETTRPTDAVEPAAAQATSAEGGNDTKTGESAEEIKPSSTVAAVNEPSTTAPPATDENTTTTAAEAMDKPTTDGEPAIESPSAAAPTNGTPASSKKGGPRRKSGAGIPEHKKKQLSKKKSTPKLRLDVEPGDYYFVAMRGFPPWPVIVCDEEMLPETLLSKRPVSAKRIDGTYREDFEEGGKNAKDRRYPIMFLGTNEFAWQVNTDLQPFDVDQIKKDLDEENKGKKNKSLMDAYRIAAEEHDLEWFKNMLEDHENAIQADLEEKAAAEAKKLEKKEKSKRKSTAADEEEDVEMEDVGEDGDAAPKKPKSAKKRKKEAESDGEPDKPLKTPKIKLKTGKDDSAAKPKSQPKPKKAKAKGGSDEEDESPKVEEKPMTEAERKEKREKGVLYLRHRLQKGFLARDQMPKEEEMAKMAEHFKQLEGYADLEADIIRRTKIHKVLKAIIKLNSIPKEEEYQFKKRSTDLLNGWNRALAADVEMPSATDAPAEATTNGVNHEEKDDPKAEEKVEKPEAPEGVASEEKPKETPTEIEVPKEATGDGDVSMADAKDEAPAVKEDASSTETPAEATAQATATA